MEKVDLLEAKAIITSLFDESIADMNSRQEYGLKLYLAFGDINALLLAIDALLSCGDEVPKWIGNLWKRGGVGVYSSASTELISYSKLASEIRNDIKKVFTEELHTEHRENCTQTETRTSCWLCDKRIGGNNCDNEPIEGINW